MAKKKASVRSGVEPPPTIVATTVSMSQTIETAMEQAIKDIQTESEAIWSQGITDAEKKIQIDALNTPENIRARMMEARAKVKVG